MALAQHPKDFPDIYRALVSAGEHSGHLGVVLERLATSYRERATSSPSKIRLAFTYPAIVTVVAFAIVIFLLSYVVPQVVSVFANTKQKLPTLTIVMLALSRLRAELVVGGAGRDRGGHAGHPQQVLRQPDVRLAWHRRLLTAHVGRQADPGLQHGALCQHAGHPGLGRRRRSCAALPQAAGETLTNLALKTNADDATTRACAKPLRRARAGRPEPVPTGAGPPDPPGEATGNLPIMRSAPPSAKARNWNAARCS